MKNKFILVFAFLFALACNKDTPSTPQTYVISGKTIDEQGQGISGIKIRTDLAHETFSDNQGNWTLHGLTGVNRVYATSADFRFSPSEFVVSSETSAMIFEGVKKVSANEILLSNWLSKQQLSNGLLESTENGNLVSLYDNALAALAFMAYGNFAQAEKVLDFFDNRIDTELLVGNGGFSQFRDKNGTPNGKRWLGDNAWLLIAVNNYKALQNNQKYSRLQAELENWIIGLQDADGGIWGGYEVDNTQIHKITEGNIDAFNAVNGYTVFHQKLLNFLENDRWNDTDKLLIAWKTNPSYYYAMDLHPWGFCIFEDFPVSVLTAADRYLNTQTATINNATVTGYCFDEDKDAVWLEGTGEMIVAFNKANQPTKATYYLQEMEKMIQQSTLYQEAAGIPYATNLGTGYGADLLWDSADKKPFISSVTWYLFGKSAFNPFAVNYNKNIPTNDKFWLD